MGDLILGTILQYMVFAYFSCSYRVYRVNDDWHVVCGITAVLTTFLQLSLSTVD